jgi:CO dehydrogenase/acetyl-CoA synthase gamma subunit (corrinoid Fe-S protein)
LLRKVGFGVCLLSKLLPMTNFRECGESTCMVFATRVAEGANGSEDCPELIEENCKKLRVYMSQFKLDL